MARMRTPVHVKKLIDALRASLRDAGIHAEIEAEPVSGTRLHRIYVVAPQFKALAPSERQDLVWRIAQQALTPEEQLRISMLLTLTEEELSGAGA